MTRIPSNEELFDLSHTLAARLLKSCHYGYRAIGELKSFIPTLFPTLGDDFEEIAEGVFAAKDAKISAAVTLSSPMIIGKGAEIRQGALLRGSVLIGDKAVIGNSTEVKNSIIFDGAKLPHYNYVGDSIIGYLAHFGAGAVASNQRLDKRTVTIRSEEESIQTGLKKLGAMIADRAEIGCHSVLSPGAIVGRGSMIYPLSHVRGCIDSGMIFDGRRVRKWEDFSEPTA